MSSEMTLVGGMNLITIHSICNYVTKALPVKYEPHLPSMKYLYLEYQGGILTAVATDGFRLHSTIDDEMECSEEFKMLLDGETITEVFSKFKEISFEIYAVNNSADYIFRGGDTVVYCKNHIVEHSKYFDYDRVFKMIESEPEAVSQFNPRDLINAVKSIKDLPRNYVIQLDFEKNALSVKAVDKDNFKNVLGEVNLSNKYTGIPKTLRFDKKYFMESITDFPLNATAKIKKNGISISDSHSRSVVMGILGNVAV